MIKSLCFLVCLTFSACATLPLTKITGNIGWEHLDPLEYVLAYHYTVSIDSGPHRPIKVTCIAVGANTSSCKATLPPMILGEHEIILAVTNATSSRQVVQATVISTLLGIIIED